MTDFYVNASGAPVTPSMLTLVTIRSGLQWEMHPAQLFSIELGSISDVTIVKKEITEEEFKAIKFPETKHTLMGIPVVMKAEYPKTLVRLMYGDKEVTRIENLAVPSGFSSFNHEEQECERRKMETIGYRPPRKTV
jgi:hypothetical protein